MSGDKQLPAHAPWCMGCGEDNPNGLHLEVHLHGDHVYADLQFDERHSGAPGLAHGGAISAACDDIMGFTLWIARTPAVTRTLTVEYRRPVPLHTPIRLTAWIDHESDRLLHIAAAGSFDEQTYFTSSGVFVKVDVAHFRRYADVSTIDDFFANFTRTD